MLLSGTEFDFQRIIFKLAFNCQFRLLARHMLTEVFDFNEEEKHKLSHEMTYFLCPELQETVGNLFSICRSGKIKLHRGNAAKVHPLPSVRGNV